MKMQFLFELKTNKTYKNKPSSNYEFILLFIINFFSFENQKSADSDNEITYHILQIQEWN